MNSVTAVIYKQGVKEMLENLKLGLIILLTGIVIVFTVLILLIGVIKLYSSLVVSIQQTIDEKKHKKAEDESKKAEAAVEPKIVETVAAEPEQPVDDGTVPGEIVAAIAAAVEVIFGEGSIKIKSIKKSSKRRSVWKSAGVAENTRSF